jgi:hypothetical protein
MSTLQEISNCLKCGKPYDKVRSTHVYCTTSCRKAAHNKQKIDKLAAIKLERGCCKCGYNTHPAALHFNHIDPSTKSFNIGSNGSKSLEELILETEKCEVLCANCHAIHTIENGHHLSRPT